MPDTFRILVTGSRDWDDHLTIHEALTRARWDAGGPLVIVHGAWPTGADDIAAWWARQYPHLHITDEPHPADWNRYGRRAGFRRNAEMVALGADLCLAFIAPCTKRLCPKRKPHGSHGATHTADLAEKAGIPVRRFPHELSPEEPPQRRAADERRQAHRPRAGETQQGGGPANHLGRVDRRRSPGLPGLGDLARRLAPRGVRRARRGRRRRARHPGPLRPGSEDRPGHREAAARQGQGQGGARRPHQGPRTRPRLMTARVSPGRSDATCDGTGTGTRE
ncbi:DUF2493 domain-containing protein [Microbispora triticiradicis]|nr:DUF2493 domain-containing protein [Microbispora triticiradicis]